MPNRIGTFHPTKIVTPVCRTIVCPLGAPSVNEEIAHRQYPIEGRVLKPCCLTQCLTTILPSEPGRGASYPHSDGSTLLKRETLLRGPQIITRTLSLRITCVVYNKSASLLKSSQRPCSSSFRLTMTVSYVIALWCNYDGYALSSAPSP